MRALDIHHRQGKEEGGDESHAPVEQPASQEEQKKHRPEIEKSRKDTAHQMNLIIGGTAYHGANELGEEQGQRSVKVYRVLVARVQGGLAGIKILGQALRPLDAVYDHGRMPFVGVDVIRALIPVYIVETKCCAQHHNAQQGQEQKHFASVLPLFRCC